MTDDLIHTTLPPEVFKEELDTVVARRAAAGLDEESPRGVDGDQPSVERGLVGLALSGGGIRSSTFGLGVIQSLARGKIFRHVDYLSTVSGGGYTGSMLSSLLRDRAKPKEGFPLEKPEGQEEPPALQHLRNGSNYLSPGGALNALRLPAVVLRGLVLNALLLLPFLMLAVVVTELIHEYGHGLTWDLAPQLFLGQWMKSDLHAIPVIGGGLLILYLLLAYIRKGEWEHRNRYELGFTVVLAAVAAVIVAIPLLVVIRKAIDLPLYGDLGLKDYIEQYFAGGVWVGAAVVSAGAYAMLKASENLSKIVSKVTLFAVGLAGPAILFGLYLLMLVAQVDSPFIPRDQSGLDSGGTADVATMVTMAGPLRRSLLRKGIVYPDSATTVPAVYCAATEEEWERLESSGDWHLARPSKITMSADLDAMSADVDAICGTDSLVPTGPGRWERHRGLEDADVETSDYYRLAQRGDDLEVIGAMLRFGGTSGDQALLDDWSFIGLMLMLFLLNYLFLDVNKSSLHSFYRDRLSKLYLFRREGDGVVEADDTQRLSELNGPGSTAPYHLINTTLNLQGVVEEAARGRESDFFFFSKHFCGGAHTGYCKTSDLEAWDPHVDLGTAMAISAAAAAPNMGRTTIRPLIFVLTLLNLRLGYWLPNPKLVNTKKRPRFGRRLRPGSLYLLREARGQLDASHDLVNVSDGGHLENLAVYELLRRRCEVIIAIDGEADPDITFDGLVTLMRIAKIDLGVDIQIDEVNVLRLDSNRRSGDHFAVGTIDYGNGQEGKLVYVKSSVTGDEDPFVHKYRADNPDFPHQTTADQFFDEVQFEVYRSLGNHVGDKLRADSRTASLPGFGAQRALAAGAG